MLPSLVLPPLADSAPLLTCLLDLVWGRPLSDVEITVVSQVSNGCFVIFEIALVERPAAVCLTVVLNVVCHSERESAQGMGGCPFLDLMSLFLLELHQLPHLLVLRIPHLVGLVRSQILGSAVP